MTILRKVVLPHLEGGAERNRRGRHLRHQAIILFATGFYTGYLPLAPGTWGSVLGLLVFWGIFGPLLTYSAPVALIVYLCAFVVCSWIAGRAEEILGEHDSPRIVIDEILGMVATMVFNPMTWFSTLTGFVLFRAFDILKPYPARLIERRLSGGTAVMLDDLVAAIYANLVLRALRALAGAS